jgi:hypothetical protein
MGCVRREAKRKKKKGETVVHNGWSACEQIDFAGGKILHLALLLTFWLCYFILRGGPQRELPNSSGDANTKCLYFGQRQRGGARHSGAPMLRRYVTTSALLRSMAILSAVLPSLQGR